MAALLAWTLSATTWPGNIILGAVVIVVPLLLWVLFLSPVSVVRGDAYVRSIVFLALSALAVAGLISMGLGWLAILHLIAVSVIGLALAFIGQP